MMDSSTAGCYSMQVAASPITHRLYLDDVARRTFDAEVIAHHQLAGRPAVILDRSAFYPEGGGQLGDRGSLSGVPVVDTQVIDDAVVHVLGEPGSRWEIGARVHGELDWERRRQHMAQHTAQHLLSGALLDRAAAATVSARLGESALTIDVARDRIPESDLAAAEALANDLIDDDLPIRAWFPPPDELAGLKLRRDPKVDSSIRVVAIGDFDLSPCGGTHCTQTAQLAAIRITGSERYKGMTRVTFTAARRGRLELFARDAVLRGLASQFSCGPHEVPAAIDKLRRTAEAHDAELTQLRGRLADLMIAQLAAGDGAVVAALPCESELLRTIAAKLVRSGRDAILAANDGDGTVVVIMRSDRSTLDCGALFKRISGELGGRGGGRAERAEGRVATAVTDWPSLIARLL